MGQKQDKLRKKGKTEKSKNNHRAKRVCERDRKTGRGSDI